MKKKSKRLLSCLLSLVIVLSSLPVSAAAASSIDPYYCCIEDKCILEDGKCSDELASQWNKAHANTINSLSLNLEVYELPLTAEGNANLRIVSPDMISDGKQDDTSIIPYFYEYSGTEKVGKYVLKEILLCPGYIGYSAISADSPQIEATAINSVDINQLNNLAAQDPVNGANRLSFYFVWTLKGLNDDDENPEITMYTIHYTLNRGGGKGQLPESVGVSYKGTMNFDVEDTYFTDGTVMGGNTADLYPLGYPIDVEAEDFKTNDACYGLIGWKCEDPACGTEGHPLHQVGHKGDTLTATASMAGDDKVITLSAQWSHAVLPEPEKMAQISSTDDPPLYKLGVPKDDKGNDALITQHTLKDGKPVADELMLDLKDCQIYYEATVLMDDTVAQALNGYTVWGGSNFAQFQIQVAMDKNLTLVDEDSDGYVEFTFTCPFLRPVKGQEVLADGASVTDVSVNYTQSPYTYKVPVNALQNEGGIRPFTIVVEWNPEKGSYSYDELRQPITLATAKATTESKLDLKTTGTVTGWIDPAASGLTANMQSQLTGLMLGNSPTLNNYLTQTLGLSRQQAAKAMENFLTSTAWSGPS